jgi:hypothetical protein
MSATYENILEKLKKSDPNFIRAMDVIEEGIKKFYETLRVQPPIPVRIIFTEDMTEEEKEIQYIEYYMKYEGLTIEEAEQKAKEMVAMFNTIFDEPH